MPLMDEKGMLWMKQLFLWMKQLILWMRTSLFRVMDQKVILWMKQPNLWKKKNTSHEKWLVAVELIQTLT